MSQHESDNAIFDRLVDGELPTPDRRLLLASLDDQPGGWRRCALAFLEAQALGSELKAMRTSMDLEPEALREEKTLTLALSQRERERRGLIERRWQRMLGLVAVAASIVAAFAVGVFAPQVFRPKSQDVPLAGNLISPAENNGTEASDAGVPHQTLRPIGNLRLVMDGQEDTQEARQVPLFEASGGWEQVLAASPPGIGPELIDVMRQLGYDVEHEQQYIPAKLEDGREVVVPVEGYQITPVSRRYQ